VLFRLRSAFVGWIEHWRRRHRGRFFVVEDGLGTLGDQAHGLGFADPFGGDVAAFGQDRRAVMRIMRVGGQDVHEPVVEHALAPVLRLAAEAAGQGAGSDLNPGAFARGPNEPLIVFIVEPSQAFRVRDDRDVARRDGVVEGFVKADGHRMVGRFEQVVAGLMQRGVRAPAQAEEQFGHKLDVGTVGQLQPDIGLREFAA
jgi:hypothetical protein